MRVACVLITHLRARAELRRHAHLKDKPVVIVDRSRARPLVVDSSPGAPAVTAGMTLEQAVSHHAGTIVLEADEPYYHKLFNQVIESLQGVSDQVERAELGTAYVGLKGLETLYGGEARLIANLLNALPAYLNPRVGVGDAKFPAFIAARDSRTLGAARVPVDVQAFLAPRSIDLLPVSPNALTAMHRFGMHTMGQVSVMPERLMVDQFGAEGRRIWALCNGMDDSPLQPLRFEETVVEYASLPFYSTSLEVLLVAVDTLLSRAYARPWMKGRYASKASLECSAFGVAPWGKTIPFKGGVGEWERASHIIRSRLELDPPQAPAEDVTLTLSDFTGDSGAQLGLMPDVRESRQRQLLEVERRLQASQKRPSPRPGATSNLADRGLGQVGRHALYRVVPVAPWHPAPEMRHLQVPLDPSGKDAIKSLHRPTPVAVQEGEDHDPLAVRLGKRWHRVAGITDRWTFDLWWFPNPLNRTYYRVDREDGGQVTLFRDENSPKLPLARGGVREDCWYQQGR